MEAFSPSDLQNLRERLGFLPLWSPLWPWGQYSLDLSTSEGRAMAGSLLQAEALNRTHHTRPPKSEKEAAESSQEEAETGGSSGGGEEDKGLPEFQANILPGRLVELVADWAVDRVVESVTEAFLPPEAWGEGDDRLPAPGVYGGPHWEIHFQNGARHGSFCHRRFLCATRPSHPPVLPAPPSFPPSFLPGPLASLPCSRVCLMFNRSGTS